MSCDLPISALEAALVRPAWADPRWMLASNDVLISSVTFPDAEPHFAIGANPRRWAIGFVLRSPLVADLQVAPWPDVRAGGWVSDTAHSPIWLTMFDHGPLIQRAWYAIADDISVLRIVECVVN